MQGNPRIPTHEDEPERPTQESQYHPSSKKGDSNRKHDSGHPRQAFWALWLLAQLSLAPIIDWMLAACVLRSVIPTSR
jgi:hypothetical protein